MEVRFYLDPKTREPHIYGHDVNEESTKKRSRRSCGVRRTIFLVAEPPASLWDGPRPDAICRSSTYLMPISTGFLS
jgi:hypothetical protein